MEREVVLPELGEDAGDEATVSAVLCEVGDDVAEGEALVEMATDKATFDVPCPFAGRVKEVRVAEDDVVPVGGVIAVVDTQE